VFVRKPRGKLGLPPVARVSILQLLLRRFNGLIRMLTEVVTFKDHVANEALELIGATLKYYELLDFRFEFLCINIPSLAVLLLEPLVTLFVHAMPRLGMGIATRRILRGREAITMVFQSAMC